MLTRATEDDWTIVLEVFDAGQSRSGEPGHDDRKFVEAMHFFPVHNVTWQALPSKFGNWNSVWKRFWRLSRTGVFEAFFQLLAETSPTANLVQMCDSTVVRAHASAAGAKGGSKTRRSGGGFSCKIHLKTDFRGSPIAFHLTGGEVNNCTQFTTSLDIGPDIQPRAVMTDKGDDSKGRARIEQAVGKVKRLNRIALRCEKTAESNGARLLDDLSQVRPHGLAREVSGICSL